MRNPIRKIHLGLLLFVALASSCTKDGHEAPINVSPDTKANRLELIKEVEKLPTSVVPLGYVKLNSSEKVEFWLRHVDRYLKQHPELSPELVAHIQKLKTFADVKLYDQANSPEMQKHIKDFEQSWYYEPIKRGTFPAKELTEVSSFRGTGTSEQTLQGLKSTTLLITETPGSSTCNCIYDLGCASGKYCYGKPECGPGQGAPATCGVFGTSRCSGKCE